jgi:ABC-type uncharacterized transport system permease subunit
MKSLNKFEAYIDAIISAILSFIITVAIIERFGIDNLLAEVLILLLNYTIILLFGSYLINQLKK